MKPNLSDKLVLVEIFLKVLSQTLRQLIRWNPVF